MSEAVSAAEWQRLLHGLLGLAVDDTAAAAVAAGMARYARLVATATPGALFDVEPSQHDRALASGHTP